MHKNTSLIGKIWKKHTTQLEKFGKIKVSKFKEKVSDFVYTFLLFCGIIDIVRMALTVPSWPRLPSKPMLLDNLITDQTQGIHSPLLGIYAVMSLNCQ